MGWEEILDINFDLFTVDKEYFFDSSTFDDVWTC